MVYFFFKIVALCKNEKKRENVQKGIIYIF
jgi:hypothetical protein